MDVSLLIVFIVSKHIIQKEYNYRLSINYPYNSLDIRWTDKNVIKLIIYSFFVGFFAEIYKIEGGIIMSLIFILEFGLHPIITISTTGFIIMIEKIHDIILLNFEKKQTFGFLYSLDLHLCAILGSLIGCIYFQKRLDMNRKAYLLYQLLFLIILIISITGFSSIIK